MKETWHPKFANWAKPPTDKEEQKASNAADLVRQTLRGSEHLKGRSFDVYPTGSYRNNTNVKLGSDIDIAVVLNDAFYPDYPDLGIPSREMLGFTNATYDFPAFQADVKSALLESFGEDRIMIGDKAFKIRSSRTLMDSDVTPFLQYRRYTGQKSNDGTWLFEAGQCTRSRKDPSKRIVNWHTQHYDQGVKRNAETKRRFKRVTRILKQLRDEMVGSKDSASASSASRIPSILIECLTFNAPDRRFNIAEDSYYEDVREVIRTLWNVTQDDNTCGDFTEVNRMKRLFSADQTWTRPDANEFLRRAWHYVGFKN